MSKRKGVLRRVTVGASILGVLVVTALTVGGNAFSSPSTKYYTASINPTSAPGSTLNYPFTITIHNCGPADPAPCKPSTQYLGSANVTIPTGFQSVAITGVTQTNGKTWTASLSGNVLQLRNPGPNTSNALAPGQEVKVAFTATTPSSCNAAPTFQTQTKQSNDFSGTGNNFTEIGTDPTVSINPGALHHFTITNLPAPATAGVPFNVTVTAYDGCGNVDTNYNGGAGFSIGGLDNSPNGTAATYGRANWGGGSATVTVTGYDASSTEHLTATDSSAGVTSQQPPTSFTIQPGDPFSYPWTTQPTESAKGPGTLNGPPTVTVKDQWGNAVGEGKPVNVTLTKLGGATGTLSGDTTVNTNASGVAAFNNLAISTSGEYQLSDNDSTLSSAFLVVDQLNPCHGGNCPKTTGSVPNNTQTDATATNAGDNSSLAVAVLANETAPPDNGTCASAGNFGFFPLGVGSFVNVITTGSPAQANYTITWTLDKSIVNSDPDNSASHFDICLGAVNVNDPHNGSLTGWQTKTGNTALPVLDTNLNEYFYWGIVPDCPNKGTPRGPCVQSRHKDNAGDEVITFYKPAPWDGHYFGGGP